MMSMKSPRNISARVSKSNSGEADLQFITHIIVTVKFINLIKMEKLQIYNSGKKHSDIEEPIISNDSSI